MILLQGIKQEIVGHEREIEMILYALDERIPVILEGVAGTGKTELCKSVAKALNRPLFRVDGDQELTAFKLKGWFDPPIVLEKGYNWESFVPGPLSQAMLDGGIFFFNEVSRAPSESINTVLTALDERILTIPRLGMIEAKDGFISIFTFNPVDRIASNPLPKAFLDRCIWVYMDHQSLEEEIEIVKMRTHQGDEHLIRLICKIVKATRNHPQLERGASVRCAIHMAKLAHKMSESGSNPYDYSTMCDISLCTLVKNVQLKHDAARTPEDIIKEIVSAVMGNGKLTDGLSEESVEKLLKSSSKAPLFISQMFEDSSLQPNLFSLKDTSAMIDANLYRRIKSQLTLEQREKMLRYIIPKIVNTGKNLFERNIPTKREEIGNYDLGDEWDFDATLDQIMAYGHYKINYEMIKVRKKRKIKRAFVIIADRSNSVASFIDYIAVATAMLSFALKNEYLSLIAFDNKAECLKRIDEYLDIELILRKILSFESGGSTDIYAPLEMAKNELQKVAFADKEAILISDCTPTTGREPLKIISVFEKLNIFYTPSKTCIGSCLIDKLNKFENVIIYEINEYNKIIENILNIISSIN